MSLVGLCEGVREGTVVGPLQTPLAVSGRIVWGGKGGAFQQGLANPSPYDAWQEWINGYGTIVQRLNREG